MAGGCKERKKDSSLTVTGIYGTGVHRKKDILTVTGIWQGGAKKERRTAF